MEPGTNSYYTTTRVSQDGKDDKGNIIYKREVIMFDSKTKMKAFEELGSANKSQLGANGGGVVIATGSTEKGKKTFELTEAGAKIDFVKNNEERIQKQSANQVKNIIKDENYKVKGALNDFSNNRKANNKDDSIDAAAEKEDLSKLNARLSRGEYGTMVYPSTIKNSVQDKLKISIIKPRKTNLSNTKRERFISTKTGNQLLPSDYPNVDPNKFPAIFNFFDLFCRYYLHSKAYFLYHQD